ncbi:MAG: hypothetical protein SNJ68_09320 [Cyanobacteriota bacterium]
MQSKWGRPSLTVLPSQRENWLRRYLRFLRGESPVVQAVSPQPVPRPAALAQKDSRSLQVVSPGTPAPFHEEPLSLQLWREGRKVERIFAQNRIQRAAERRDPRSSSSIIPWGS